MLVHYSVTTFPLANESDPNPVEVLKYRLPYSRIKTDGAHYRAVRAESASTDLKLTISLKQYCQKLSILSRYNDRISIGVSVGTSKAGNLKIRAATMINVTIPSWYVISIISNTLEILDGLRVYGYAFDNLSLVTENRSYTIRVGSLNSISSRLQLHVTICELRLYRYKSAGLSRYRCRRSLIDSASILPINAVLIIRILC
ncbi:hypothetical protein V1478_008843 [Vespula squamosa]|uniref:Uncharacterized protein n=1 Tax=Vespula squamosa TaxID=30214 RepID=A0ABD2AWN0_VESSQ